MSATLDKPKPETLAKIIHMSGRQWGGYLTPAEIVLLFKLGARSDGGGTFNSLDHAKARVKAGNSSPYWFYFTIGETKPLWKLLNG